MTQYIGPSWNDMARACSSEGSTIEFKPIGGGATLVINPESTRNHFAPNQRFWVQGKLSGQVIRLVGIAPRSSAPATYQVA